MGKVFSHNLFEVHVFSKDHRPAHCHVYFPKKDNYKGFIKIDLTTLEVIDLENITNKDLKRITEFLIEDRIKTLVEEWERFHGKEN